MEILAPTSPIIDAALSILADGKARTADEIFAEGCARGLFDASMTRKHVYTSLSQYIERATGAGRKPEITEDVSHRFRINRAPDDWPDLDLTGLQPLSLPAKLSTQATAAIARAQAAQAGTDPTEYEQAICDLFSSLGFAATHVGGVGAPDGYADALLGMLGYRVMIECKLVTSHGIAQMDAPAEAAKYKDGYRGTYCALVAPAYAPESTFVSELGVHGVCALTTDDLIELLQAGVAAYDLRAILATPGIAAGQVSDLLWDRVHGKSKRLRVIASIILQQSANQQQVAQHLGDTAETPNFTVDVAMSLVDAALAANGSQSPCTREEVQAALDWLTSPLVRAAAWTNPEKNAIVRIRP